MARHRDRIDAWIATLPSSIRPAATGALLLVRLLLIRGAWYLVPIAVVYVLATSHTPWADLARGAGVGALAILGGGASGLAYGVIGRRVQQAFPGGRYVAGIVTLFPYLFVLIGAIRLINNKPFWRPVTTVELAISVGMSLVYGPLIGHFWFRAADGEHASSRKRST